MLRVSFATLPKGALEGRGKLRIYKSNLSYLFHNVVIGQRNPLVANSYHTFLVNQILHTLDIGKSKQKTAQVLRTPIEN